MTEEQLQAIETRLSDTGEWDEYIKGEGEEAYWEASYRWSEEFASNVESDIAALLAEVRRLQSKEYSLDEVEQMMRNLGVDVTCGACAEIAFTSMTTSAHTCTGRQDNPADIFVSP